MIVHAAWSISARYGNERSGDNDAAAAEKQFAVLVGVSEYVNPQWNTLHAPANDVALIRGLLVNTYRFPTDGTHIVALIGKSATRKAIIDAFRNQLIANAKRYPNATLVFYYSGHGSLSSDGLHETIVPSDGRTTGIYDITDEDLNELFDELLKYVSREAKVIFILDSCHSGTLIKGLDESIRSKEIPPDSRLQPKPESRHNPGLVGKDLGTGVLVRNDAFVALAAAYSYESAYETCLPDEAGGYAMPMCRASASGKYKPYSIFTYYLTQVLTASPGLTYYDAISEVSSVVSKRAHQHPNAEGDTTRYVFGISADRDDPYFQIEGSISGRKFSINGGAIEGLAEGAYIAIYKPQTHKLTGEAGKICNARVVESADFTSIAELTETPQEPIPANAKIALVTPYFGGTKLRIAIAAPQAGNGATDPNQQYLNGVATSFKDIPFAEVVNPSATWDLSIQKGIISLGDDHCIFAQENGRLSWMREKWNAAAALAYQVVLPDQNVPLFGCHIAPSDPAGIQALAEIIRMRFRQQSVLAIRNARSPYNSKLRMGIVKVSVGQGTDGKPKITAEEELSRRDLHSFSRGDRFKLKVYNDSDDDLKVVIVDVGTSGGIQIMTPRGVGVTVPAHKAFVTPQVFKVGGESGLETFKVVAYTPADDRPDPNFAILEQQGILSGQAKNIDSPLGWLLVQATAGLAKDADLDSNLDTDSWTVAEVNVYVK